VSVIRAIVVCIAVGAPVAAADWPQWGGRSRNFIIEPHALPNAWPASGPRQLWSRALGEGHSAIVSDGRVLYTLYRPGGMLSAVRRSQEEAVIALDAATGKTVWEHRYAAPTSGVDFSAGAGPHSTPTIAGELVIAAGSNKQLIALDRRSGRVVWSHDLIGEYGATPPGRGYASSPLLYRDTIIVPVGGRGQSVMAFRVKDGGVSWKNGDYDVAPSSPILINLEGEEQLVVFAANEVVGIRPVGGERIWSHPHQTDYGLNISTPIFGPGNVLFISSAYSGGSRLLQLTKKGPATTARELWFNNRMRIHFGTAVRIGDRYYGSSGDFGPAFMVALDAQDGRVAWQNRSLGRASFVAAGNRLLMLDEQGVLALATINPDGLQVLGQTQLLSGVSWTVPTVIGPNVYARDRKNIVAVAFK
jgi:outer membrane protein assembly factor BamB